MQIRLFKSLLFFLYLLSYYSETEKSHYCSGNSNCSTVTFKVRRLVDGWYIQDLSEIFYQIYTIHGMYMDQVVSLVYGFLPSKTTSNYETMMSSLSRAGEPKFIILDYELIFKVFWLP